MARPNITVEPPGPKAQRIVKRDHRALMRTTKTTEVVVERAENWLVHDVDGNTFLDMTSGIGVVNTGHSHPTVVEAIRDQAERIVHFAGTDFYYERLASYAERLGPLVPVSGEPRTFFSNSGTESNEAALKVTRHRTGRPCVLSFLGGFHGRTMGSLALTGSKPVQRAGFQPLMAGVFHAPFPDPYRNVWDIDGYADPGELTNRALGSIERLLETVVPPEDLAACFVEPIQGEGGYIVPPTDFLGQLARLVDDVGAALVLDEVQTGFGRTGKLFAADHFHVKADVVSLAKAIASGVPMGAVVANHEYDYPTSGSHSNTYGGNLLALAAAHATLDVIENESLVDNAATVGPHLRKRLEEAQENHPGIGDVRGLGLMMAIDMVKDPATKEHDRDRRNAIVQAAFKRGVLLLPCGPSGIRFIPPLGIDTESLDAACEVLEETFKAT